MLQTNIENKIQYSETPLDDLMKEYGSDREEFNLNIEKPKTPDISVEMANTEKKTDLDGASDNGASDNGAAGQQGITENLTAEQKREIKGKREFTARFLAKNTDRGFAFINALIANTDDVDEWKAQPDDVKDIEECYFEMCQAYGWSGLPPWLNLAMCLLFTYGPAMKEAVKVRGINKELAEKAAKEEARRIIAEARLRDQENNKEKPKTETTADNTQTKIDNPAYIIDQQ